MVLHPDKSGGATTAQFMVLNEAYRVLSDPQMRRSYDDWLRSGIMISFGDWWQRSRYAAHMHFAESVTPRQQSIPPPGHVTPVSMGMHHLQHALHPHTSSTVAYIQAPGGMLVPGSSMVGVGRSTFAPASTGATIPTPHHVCSVATIPAETTAHASPKSACKRKAPANPANGNTDVATRDKPLDHHSTENNVSAADNTDSNAAAAENTQNTPCGSADDARAPNAGGGVAAAPEARGKRTRVLMTARVALNVFRSGRHF